MSDPTDDHHQHLPANPEDRKAAAALSSLNDDLGSRDPTADQEALGKAMSRLEIAAGQGGHTGGNATASAGQTKTEPQVQVKVAKVKAGDVNLLVRELDLSQVKATELLKANEGDVKKAIQAFIAVA
ncbi:huntingtin-interacting protein K [Aspergillus ruber CBS 135680]|uniref:Nascent polypeptide-associated complex subunit alpha-like UBA domain-containing protein n=1 Tax=Aspergillus ruber (strain CBS 135680) TaxID=1388766 RepID=A0A017SS03_ASPRC|nr:uncharacterized protein EURHEDRAFT_373675 [Aspergillus ruber CBS 135680]EYE99763.1 hypothetical protein EURHEDRAFT_373675 [Aspergillus ruber CBS 135680]